MVCEAHERLGDIRVGLGFEWVEGFVVCRLERKSLVDTGIVLEEKVYSHEK